MTTPDLSLLELIARLSLAAVLGAVVGFEREWRDRAAGLRTHMLVCLGAAVFTIVSAYGFTEWYRAFDANTRMTIMSDPTRIAAQIVTGIGFLGAGSIFRADDRVNGLTTAATLWVMAAIGLGVGAGFYELAVVSALLVLLVLVALRQVTHRIKDKHRVMTSAVDVAIASAAIITPVLDEVAHFDGAVTDLATSMPRRDRPARRISFKVELPPQRDLSDLLGRIAMLDGVDSVSAPKVSDRFYCPNGKS